MGGFGYGQNEADNLPTTEWKAHEKLFYTIKNTCCGIMGTHATHIGLGH